LAEQPWYKYTIGSYPYSLDILDILRVLPAGFFGGGIGSIIGKEAKSAASAGAATAALMAALERTQIAIEYIAYNLAAPGQPVYHETPGFVEHQIFVGLIESIVGAGVGALTAFLLKR